MSEITYKTEYLRVPHPLRKGNIIVGEAWEFYKNLGKISQAFTDRRCNLPRVKRHLILPDAPNIEKVSDEVARFDNNFAQNLQNKMNLDIVKSWARLGIAFSISYVIWSLPWVYAAVDRFCRVFGNFLSA